MIETHTPLNPLCPTHSTVAAEGTDYAQVLCGSYDLRFSAKGGSAFGAKRPLSSVGSWDERGEQRGVWFVGQNPTVFVFA
jgi:hypothetical protein